MKKLLYISFVDYEKSTELGIVRKIEGQKQAFLNKGFKISQLKLKNDSVYVDDELIFSIKGKIDLFVKLPLVLSKYFKKKEYFFDLVYIRNNYFNPLYYFLFRQLKKSSKTLLVEIPTYPYKSEITRNLKGNIIMLADRCNDLLVKRYINKIVTPQNYDEIKGISTIKIRNGYDFSGAKEISRMREAGKIKFISVANFSFWHGIDRLLYGMHNYHKENSGTRFELELHLVGAGNELKAIQNLQEELGLKGIVFHGPKYGVELDEVYAKADIGIGTLGLYRKNLQFVTSLKNVEYCFYGIPFIIGNPDRDMDKLPFVMEIPNDNSPVNIEEVIDWYNSTSSISSTAIQEAGRNLYDWNKQIDIILKEIA